MFVIHEAKTCLRALGRFAEALPALRASLLMAETAEDWDNAARAASTLSETEVMLGYIEAGIAISDRALKYADHCNDKQLMAICRLDHAIRLHEAGRVEEAERLWKDAENRQREIKQDQNYHF